MRLPVVVALLVFTWAEMADSRRRWTFTVPRPDVTVEDYLNSEIQFEWAKNAQPLLHDRIDPCMPANCEDMAEFKACLMGLDGPLYVNGMCSLYAYRCMHQYTGPLGKLTSAACIGLNPYPYNVDGVPPYNQIESSD